MGEGQTKELKGMKRNHYKQAYISMLKNLFPISKKKYEKLTCDGECSGMAVDDALLVLGPAGVCAAILNKSYH